MILKNSAIKINSIQKILSTIIIFCLFFWTFFRYFSSKSPEMQTTETTTVLISFAKAEESYFKAQNQYATNSQVLRVALPSKNSEVYFSNKDVPDAYLKNMHENSMPYISQKSFRLLGIYKDVANHKIFMWTIDNTKNVEFIGYLTY